MLLFDRTVFHINSYQPFARIKNCPQK